MAENSEQEGQPSSKKSAGPPARQMMDEELGNRTDGVALDQAGHRSSLVSGNGEDEERAAIPAPNAGRDEDFEVKFDGDKDLLNPRNKSKLQKWLITLIVSSCSFCV